jgi:hypothetical protein
MKEAHKHLNISEGQWQAMVADFKATLDAFKKAFDESARAIIQDRQRSEPASAGTRVRTRNPAPRHHKVSAAARA